METVQLSLADTLIIGLYMLLTLGIAVYFTKSAGKSTKSYFVADSKIPYWAAGLSIYATTLSAITFMATPEQAYLNDWSYAFTNVAIFAIVPLLIWFYIPFFRKLGGITAYEYLEERFGPLVRLLGSLLFILFHIGRIAIVIYLPTLAISSVTTLNPIWLAIAIGLISVVYTVLGGMEGVIWSDALQGVVLLAGAVIILGVGLASIDGGLSTVVSDATEEQKFISSENFSINNIGLAIPIIFLGSIFNTLHQYTASQDVVQRYQTTPTVKDTAKSLMTNGYLALLTIPLFYGIGTMLFSYYQRNGGLPEEVNTSAIVPYFVVHALPIGVAGIVIAAILAAAQSTISSSLNSISACATVDVYERFLSKGRPASVLFARTLILVAGVFSMAAAMYLVVTNRSETWDLFLDITGLFGVPLAAIFFLGVLTMRSNYLGVAGGIVCGVIAAALVRQLEISAFVTSITAFTVTVIAGYLISLLIGSRRGGTTHNIRALTVYGLKEKYNRVSDVEKARLSANAPETRK